MPRFKIDFTPMLAYTMSSSDKLKLPEVRFLTSEEDQQLTHLAEDIAQKMLGPDWKQRQEERRATLSEKTAQQQASGRHGAPAHV